MRRVYNFLLLMGLLMVPSLLHAQYTKLQGWCEDGNVSITIPGTQGSGTQKFQRSFPSCTVTIFNAGTVTNSTIYSNTTGTAKANPFTAATSGQWFFYGTPGVHYDVKFSNGGISIPFTLGDLVAQNDINTLSVQCGGVDDTAALASVFAAASGGKQVDMPAGTCVTTATITLNSETSIQCAGKTASIIYLNSTTASQVLFNATNADRIQIHNCGIRVNGNSQIGLYLFTSVESFIENSRFYSAISGSGIGLYSRGASYQLNVIASQFENLGTGIQLGLSTDGSCANVQEIIGSKFTSNVTGMSIQCAQNVNILASRFELNSAYGITTVPGTVTKVLIQGGYFETNTTAHINIASGVVDTVIDAITGVGGTFIDLGTLTEWRHFNNGVSGVPFSVRGNGPGIATITSNSRGAYYGNLVTLSSAQDSLTAGPTLVLTPGSPNAIDSSVQNGGSAQALDFGTGGAAPNTRVRMTATGETLISTKCSVRNCLTPSSGVPLTVTINAANAVPAPSTAGLTPIAHYVSGDSVAATFLVDSFGTNNSISMRRADGTLGSPTAIQSGETLGHIGGAGYGTAYTGIRSALDFVATETWNGTNQGARATGYGTPNGSITPVLVFAYDGVGVFGDAITVGNAPATNTKNYLSLGTVAVGSLPAAGATNAGQIISVTNSTAIAAEGQVCAAGGAAVRATAISDGVQWKCF